MRDSALSDAARRTTLSRDLPAQALAATIQTTAVADTDELMVTLDTVSTSVLRGPCRGWQPRGAALPQIGDAAAVIVLDDQTLWIIAWWPAM